MKIRPENINYEQRNGSDYVQRKGLYRREVWETSKAHDFGFCKWHIQYLDEGYWWVIVKSDGYMTVDVAMAQSEQFLDSAIRNNIGPAKLGEE
jgi:flavin-dependent dehydrogenase